MEQKIIQITSGRGPAECCWVVAQLLKYLLKETKCLNIKSEVIHREKGMENGTLLSASLKISGNDLSDFVADWNGSVLWIGQSTFRKYHKRKNWFIGVSFDNVVSKANYNMHGIQFQAIRSSGPGGQHVNKVSTAIRAKHLPTGKSVHVSNTRSQFQNKQLAIERLNNLLEQDKVKQLKEQQENNWSNHNSLDRGNPIKTFKGEGFRLVK